MRASSFSCAGVLVLTTLHGSSRALPAKAARLRRELRPCTREARPGTSGLAGGPFPRTSERTIVRQQGRRRVFRGR